MPRPRPSDRATLAQADDCREQDRDQVTQRGVHDRQQDGRSVLLISLAWPPAFAGACPRRPRGRCAGRRDCFVPGGRLALTTTAGVRRKRGRPNKVVVTPERYPPTTGMFWRLLAPRPLRRVGRIAHPVHLLEPRPVRRVGHAAWSLRHPIRRAETGARSTLYREHRRR